MKFGWFSLICAPALSARRGAAQRTGEGMRIDTLRLMTSADLRFHRRSASCVRARRSGRAGYGRSLDHLIELRDEAICARSASGTWMACTCVDGYGSVVGRKLRGGGRRRHGRHLRPRRHFLLGEFESHPNQPDEYCNFTRMSCKPSGPGKMARALACVAAFALLCALCSAQLHPSPELFASWMAEGGVSVSGSGRARLSFGGPVATTVFARLCRACVAHRLRKAAGASPALHRTRCQLRARRARRRRQRRREVQGIPLLRVRTLRFAAHNAAHAAARSWIPPYVESVVPNAPAVSWSAPCFKSNIATMSGTPGNYSISVTVSEPSGLFCSDMYLIATIDGLMLQTFFTHGTHTFAWKLSASASEPELWDVANKGVRFFRFVDGPLQTIGDLLSTLVLFTGELTKGVPAFAAKANLDFMKKYRGVTMVRQLALYARLPADQASWQAPRNNSQVEIDESMISSGDFFGIIRLDGLGAPAGCSERARPNG
jgi:hypothetical protein